MAFVIITAIAFILIAPIALALWLYQGALAKKQASFVAENTIEARVTGADNKGMGGNFHSFMMNVDGHHIINNGYQSTIVEDSEEYPAPPQNWFEQHWGFYWVGLLYPAKRVGAILISKHRLRNTELCKGKSLDEWIEAEEDVLVKFLLREFPRPILTGQIEMPQDNAKIRILFVATFRVVVPYKPFFVYRGKFFDLLDKTVSGAVDVWLRTYRKDGMSLSSQDVRKNVDKVIQKLIEEVRASISKETLELYGIELTDLRFIDSEVDASAQKITEAQQQNAVEIAEAVARETRSTSIAAETRRLGEADIEVMRGKAGAVKDNPEAARVLAAAEIAKIQGLKSLGGGALLNIDAGEDPKPPAQKQPPKK